MPGKKAPKVAYAVFVGRNPGVYSTWSEAEEQVKGFSRCDLRGYTTEEGGRARAEDDFQEFGKKTAVMKEDENGLTRRLEQTNTKLALCEEPIRDYVSGHMAQSSASCHCVAEQLHTPPNTLVGKKKERPPSWEARDELRKKTVCVNDDGTVRGVMGLESEHSHVHITSHTPLSAIISFRDADDCSIEDSRSAGEEPLSPDRSDIIANDNSSDKRISSDCGSENTSSDGNRFRGDCGYGEEGDPSCQMSFAKNSGHNRGASPVLVKERVSEVDIASELAYPQLTAPKTIECAELLDVASRDRSGATDPPSVTSDHFGPAVDHAALDTSSDYGDFVEDVTVLDRISANGPRIEPRLCAEQLALVGLVEMGKNVFYTGSAGSGKSAVLKHIVTLLRKEGKRVVTLAPTGRAALEVNGRTLHNYAGWVPRSLRQPLKALEANARGKKVRKRLRATDVLIIDEISMVANHVFERLDRLMRSARDSEKPFGGVQIIVTGDFCQLPPVHPFECCLICGTGLGPAIWGQYECDKCLAQYEEIDKWAFCSNAWQECDFEHVNLTVIHRQKDTNLRALLEKCRLGETFSVDEKWLLLDHASETTDAVRLFPRRVNVKDINDKEFAQLPGRALAYPCLDNFYWNPDHDTLQDKRAHCPAPMGHALVALEEHSLEPNLVLKEGMLVMLLVNWDLDSNLANGSQGSIVGFEKHDPSLFPEVPRDWDYSSRKNGLLRVFVKRSAVREWPIVEFHNGKRRTIYPRCMMNELGDDEPYSLLSRTQIPLTAAWAMTVHKAQGMTLSRVIVDLSHSFEPGQEYVALSRAETLRGLKVEGLPKKRTGPDAQVIKFMMRKNLMPVMNWDNGCDAKSERVKEIG